MPSEAKVSIKGVPIDIASTPDESITLDQWMALRANSAGYEAIYPKLNRAALTYVVEHNLHNCNYPPPPEGTYPHVLQTILVPLLLKRLNHKEER